MEIPTKYSSQPGRTLYVGFDDSNHAGNREGEIILATHSILSEDGKQRLFPNTRDYQVAEQWLKNGERGYRFSILLGEAARHSPTNLPDYGHIILRKIIEELPYPIAFLSVGFDGILPQPSRRNFESKFEDIPLKTRGYIKKTERIKGKIIKRPNCPQTVRIADILSHNLFGNYTLEQLLNHPNYVPLE